jgi:CheY-like chemotaxis protein
MSSAYPICERSPPQRSSSRHVLIVEDNADCRETQRILLELLGHHVEVAADGMEGVKKALAGRPEVALIDIGLPGLDGYEVATRLRRALGGRVFLIAQTAYGQHEDREHAFQVGFDVHLVKPVDLDELLHWLAVAPPGEETSNNTGGRSDVPRPPAG